MTLRRLFEARYWWLTLSYAIALALVIVGFRLGVDLWWYGPMWSLVFVPQVVNTIKWRRAWHRSDNWAVAAVVLRPLADDERTRLGHRGYEIDNMVVRGLVWAPTVSDAVDILYRDLCTCMQGTWGLEEIYGASPGPPEAAYRVMTMTGSVNDVMAALQDKIARDDGS
jgi:hypothetical protein